MLISNATKRTKCTIYFKTGLSISDYILTLSGTTQGDGSLVEENGYRYEGKDPNNYVTFNNELWRIIGVFDSDTHGIANTNLVKIIRDESIANLAWASSDVNDWTAASLQTILNGDYYNKTGYYNENGLDEISRSMVNEVKWFLGGSAGNSQTANTFYYSERGTSVITGRPTQWTGRVGLMYPSDYGYSAPASTCVRTTTLNAYTYSGCYNNSWLYKASYYQWTISPFNSNKSYVFLLYNAMSGSTYNGVVYSGSPIAGYGVVPSLYLNSDVLIRSGDGSKINPYTLEI